MCPSWDLWSLKNLNKKIKLLEKNKDSLEKQNDILKKNMTKNKYPRGMYIYIIEDDKLYKIGYTSDLQKRINNYNVGKANKAEFKYYRKTNCGREIETCMKAILNIFINLIKNFIATFGGCIRPQCGL